MNRATRHCIANAATLLLTGFAFLLLFHASAMAGQLVVEKSILKKDTLWQGQVLVKGDVEVAPGVTLTIMPGTVVRFARITPNGPAKLTTDRTAHFPRAELIVKGRLLAQGTPDARIIFTSAADDPQPADWGAVNFLNSTDNILEFCEFSYGHTSVHAHGAQMIIANSFFHHNGVAIGMKNVKGAVRCVVAVMYNRITDNGGGVLFGKGSTPTITHNEISNNKFFGIYVKKGGQANIRYNNITDNGKGVLFYAVKGFVLRDNNIARNTDYNISMLEGQEADVDARRNWWGTTDAERINTLIRDKTQDNTLGSVDFSGFTKAPVAGAGLPM